MVKRIEIADHRADLLEDAARLRASIWGGSPAENLAYLDWKYQHNPYLPEPVVQFALAEGRVVGMRASVGTSWEVPGTGLHHVIPHGADALVDPAYRREGVFRAMILRAREVHRERGFAHTMTLSANAVSGAALESEGWRLVGAPETLERRPRRSTPRIFQRAAAVMPSKPSTNVLGSLDGMTSEGVSITAAAQSRAMAEVSKLRPATTRLRHVRDVAYFEWRFGNPLCEYRFLFLGGDAVEAYAVAQWGGNDAVVNIIDWEGAAPEALPAFLEVLERARFGAVRVWGSTIDGPTAECLAEAGYRPLKPKDRPHTSFFLRPVSDVGEAAWMIDGFPAGTMDSWSLRMADSDAY